MTAFRDELVEAAVDYAYLLDRGYPERASGLLVGNRRRLDADERIMLFRGMASAADSARRRALLGGPPRGGVLLVDGYNVAFTLLHYWLGKPCFLSSDGLLRDAGANYGRVPHEVLLSRAFSELVEWLEAVARAAVPGLEIAIFLDAPVSRSGSHADELRDLIRGAGPGARNADVFVERSADGAILSRLAIRGAAGSGEGNRREGSSASIGVGDGVAEGFADESEGGTVAGMVVATSDSALVDRAPKVWDLARELLEKNYGAVFPDFGAALRAGSSGGHAIGPCSGRGSPGSPPDARGGGT